MNREHPDDELFNAKKIIKAKLETKKGYGIYPIIVRNYHEKISEYGPKLFAESLEIELSLKEGSVNVKSLYSALARYKKLNNFSKTSPVKSSEKNSNYTDIEVDELGFH